MESQGFFSHIDEELSVEADRLKIIPVLLKGNRNIDLPMIGLGVVLSADHMPPNTTYMIAVSSTSTSSVPVGSYVNLSTSFLQAHIDFSLHQIVQVKSLIALYEN